MANYLNSQMHSSSILRRYPRKKPFYDATGGPFTHSKISKYVELYTEDGIKGVCPCSSIMERTILPLIMTGEKKSFGQWMHKVYWSCRNSGFDGETAGEVGKLEYLLTVYPGKTCRYALPPVPGSFKGQRHRIWKRRELHT